MALLNLLLSLFVSLSSAQAHSQTLPIRAPFLKKFPHISWYRCFISDWNGKILKKLSGDMCLFNDDGTWFSISQYHKHLTSFDADGNVLWRRDGDFHHHLSFDSDRKHILTLSTEYATVKKNKIRYDVALKIDLSGNVAGRFSFKENQQKLLKLHGEKLRPGPIDQPDADVEFSHANSIYEINVDENNAFLPPFLKSGFYILNSIHLNVILILDRDLKNIVHTLEKYPNTRARHDVQITKEGHLLFYNNFKDENEIDRIKRVGFEVWDLQKHQPLDQFKYTIVSEDTCCGTVQLLNDRTLSKNIAPRLNSTQDNFWVFTENSNNGRVIVLNKQLKIIHTLNNPTQELVGIQGVEVGNFSQFLKNNRF
jgi:hypothetical protein